MNTCKLSINTNNFIVCLFYFRAERSGNFMVHYDVCYFHERLISIEFKYHSVFSFHHMLIIVLDVS